MLWILPKSLKYVWCVMASIQQHCMDWFREKITLRKAEY